MANNTTVYCWGKTDHGQLGLGDIEEVQILRPRKLPWTEKSKVVDIACGRVHTLFLTKDGAAYTCGCNDDGQLGYANATKRPRMSNFQLIQIRNVFLHISRIFCGSQFCVALNEWGQLFGWGNNEVGQLGLPETEKSVRLPTIVRDLLGKHVIQVACGNKHTLVLTSCGEVYAFGSNLYGQLGLHPSIKNVFKPERIMALEGVPVAFIACGGEHSFIITNSHDVYGWGRNSFGQLGLNDTKSRFEPTELITMGFLGIRYISCGDNFTAFLSKDGSVFTCGCGTSGQLGHGKNANELLPKQIMELMGSTVTQVACGDRHTLVYLPAKNSIYAFGLGSSGQLGTGQTKNIELPSELMGPWAIKLASVKRIYCGGDHSFVLTVPYDQEMCADDLRIYEPGTQIMTLTQEIVDKCVKAKPNVLLEDDLFNFIYKFFSSIPCWNASFLTENYDDKQVMYSKHIVNFTEAEQIFSTLANIENTCIKEMIFNAITNETLVALKNLKILDEEVLIIFLILPYYHEFENAKHYEILQLAYIERFNEILEKRSQTLSKWFHINPLKWFERMVLIFKNIVIHIISTIYYATECETRSEFSKKLRESIHLKTAMNFLVTLNSINENREHKVHYEKFYWHDLPKFFSIETIYFEWHMRSTQFIYNICNYSFLLDAEAKTIMLRTDQMIQMRTAQTRHPSMRNIIGGDNENHFLTLNVTRENIVRDAMTSIRNFSDSDLKKPLRIRFVGEEAEDVGGVRKEFFMLLVKDLMDPKYCMFKEYESGFKWFADITFENSAEYILIGVLCGLAIYNFTIIHLSFPLALYKKILGEELNLNDLCELSPTVGKSMRDILEYEGDDFEEVFDIRFEITRDLLGATKVEPLIKNGHNIAVTQKNKQEFVKLYVDYIFNKSVYSQYEAFMKGFSKVVKPSVVCLFRPVELMALVVGNEEYDWNLFEQNAKYRYGYSVDSQPIRWFWQVFHELPLEDKKKFLLFLTGSDRIPLQGMKVIKFVICKVMDVNYLPVAHTCFNMLDLPCYETKECLEHKLKQALEQPLGFSLV